MKKLLIMTVFVASISAKANESVNGGSSIVINEAYPNEASISISGDPAKILWERASSLPVISASQFNAYPFKQSKTLRCWDYTKIQEGYVCYIIIVNLSQGEVGNFQKH